MTGEDVIVRGLNGLVSYNLLRSSTKHVGVSRPRRTDDGIRFTVTVDEGSGPKRKTYVARVEEQ